jgi:hypothetical protein
MLEQLQLIVPSRVSQDVRIEVRAGKLRVLTGPVSNGNTITESEGSIKEICHFNLLFLTINFPNILNKLILLSVNYI